MEILKTKRSKEEFSLSKGEKNANKRYPRYNLVSNFTVIVLCANSFFTNRHYALATFRISVEEGYTHVHIKQQPKEIRIRKFFQTTDMEGHIDIVCDDYHFR